MNALLLHCFFFGLLNNIIPTPKTIIVPPKNPIIKCNKNSTTITKEFIMNNIIDNVNFVIIGLNNTGCIDKTPIISELNDANIGVEIMSISAACSCHNILLSEQRIFLSFILFN